MNNLGIPSQPSYTQPQLMPSDERTWAMLAHLCVLVNLVTGFLGVIAALVIYLVFKERSHYVAYHAMQSMIMQMILWGGGGIIAAIAWTVSGVLTSVFFLGCLLMPLASLISLAPLWAVVYGIIGAIQTNQGRDFRYWLVGDWVRSVLTGG